MIKREEDLPFVLICGGINHQEEPATCFSFTKEWLPFAQMTHARFGTASALTEDGNLWLVGGLGPNWMFDGFTTEIIGEHYNGSAAVQWSIQSEFGLNSSYSSLEKIEFRASFFQT